MLKILVPLKRVPDPDTRIRLKSDGSGIDPNGVKFAVNPFDAIALEEALRIKESSGEAEIVVVSIGNDECVDQLQYSSKRQLTLIRWRSQKSFKPFTAASSPPLC